MLTGKLFTASFSGCPTKQVLIAPNYVHTHLKLLLSSQECTDFIETRLLCPSLGQLAVGRKPQRLLQCILQICPSLLLDLCVVMTPQGC